MNYLLVVYVPGRIYECELSPGQSVTIGSGENDFLRIAGAALEPAHLTVTATACGVHALSLFPMLVQGDGTTNRMLAAWDVVRISDTLSMAVFEKRAEAEDAVFLADKDEIEIGRSAECDIRLGGLHVFPSHAFLRREADNWALVEDLGSANEIFVDGKLVKSVLLKKNQVVFMGGWKFSIAGDMLTFLNAPAPISVSPALAHIAMRGRLSQDAKYPYFQRSPRIKAEPTALETEVLSPPNRGSKPSISWLSVLLPPIMMMAVMVGVSSLTRNRTTLFYTVPMSGISIIIAIVNYKSQMKKWKGVQKLALEKYAAHLREKDSEITAAETKYMLASATANPGPYECAALAEERARRLWERSSGDDDFLEVRLGTGRISSNVKIKTPHAQLTLEEDPLMDEARKLGEKHKELTGIPIVHSFFSSTVTGFSGDRESVIQVARVVLLNVAAHHSYEDVKIVCVYPENEKREWAWVRWLPHVWNADRTERFVANSRARAQELLKDIAETLRRRRFESAQNDTKRKFIPPFYFLMLADKELAEVCGEELLPESGKLGMTAVYAYSDIGLLPSVCQDIVECGSPASLRSGRNAPVMFTPDRISASKLDTFARMLAPVRLQSSHGANMPAGLTFLEGWGVRRADEIDAPALWRKSRPMKSLATRIGVRENGDPFYFDVHEKSMGPHGLVAGTTGSGKSEALTTWLLSMALSFSPLDVNFFLIDFKGDGLAGVLKELPHVAGTVGNLSDASVIIRALRSLDGELKRRQHVFSRAGVKNIQSYQGAFIEGKVAEPMAYLLIVIDEFAEMHTQFPELADQFISVARTGRSLGIYLTLTMQSPGGVVKGQVESNLNFRIVLRTSGPGESREALGTPDAAAISKRTPGRAWVRSGETYELVQTFYSAASYNPAPGTRAPSAKIHVVTDDGERILPAVYERTVKAKGADDTEGAVVARYIRETAKNEGGLCARPVWTQPLPEKVFLSALLSGREAFRDGEWQPRNEGMSVAVGLVDDPENQTQYPLFLDFIKNGHYALYGSPSSGKTTFLQTAIMSAALLYTPDQVRFLVLDFGTWGLKLFERLPHTILTADANDAERVKKTEEYLLSELASRKRKFAEEGVGALKDYAEVTGNTLPVILAVVDNMAALHSQYPDVLETLIDIAREGGNLGLYLILTAGGQGSFMYKISQYIKVSIALQLTDRSEYRGLVGGDGRQEPAKLPGRGFVNGPLEFQTAIGVEGVRQRRDLCDAMSAAWGDTKPVMFGTARAIDPASLAISYEYVQIGVEKENSAPYNFVFADMNGCVISGAPKSGKTNLLGRIVRGLLADEKTAVYLYEKGSALEFLRGPGKLTVAHDGAALDAMVIELLEEYFRRVDNDTKSPRLALCIDDFVAAYGDISDGKVDALTTLILYGGDFGVYTYITGDIAGLVKFRDMVVEPFVRCMERNRAVAIGGRLADHRIFGDLYRGSGNDRLSEYEARVLRSGETRRVKVASFAQETLKFMPIEKTVA